MSAQPLIGTTHPPTPGLRDHARKKAWKDGKAQRCGRTKQKQFLLDMADRTTALELTAAVVA